MPREAKNTSRGKRHSYRTPLFINYSHSSLEVSTSTRALENFLDLVLDTIPVSVVKAFQGDVEVIRDLAKILEALVAVNQADRDTDTSEAASTPDTVQIRLRIRLVVHVQWYILVRMSTQWATAALISMDLRN